MKKVLVVDDIEINRIILHEILSDTYEIYEASNGTQAIVKMLDPFNKPHLVLLDVMMPEMDGIETFEIIKTNPECNGIPIIFITADNEEVMHLLREGADYIEKPFAPELVKRKVYEALNS